MAYVVPRARRRLAAAGDRRPTNTAELNYCITRLIKRYIEGHPRISYDVFNWVLGILDEVKFELGDRNWGHTPAEGLKKGISKIIRNYLTAWPHVSTHELTQVRGALTCVQMELYRRVVANYQDLKRETHGEIL